LPAPEAPTIATDSPEAMSNDTSCTIVSEPSGLLTRLVRFSALRTLSRIIGACALSIALWVIALQDAAAADRTILVFGDSLSAAYGLKPEQGWVALLDKRLRTQGYGYNVVNASVSGETTSGGVQRLPRSLELNKPQILILELGANDALRGLPLSNAKDNLSKMVEMGAKAGARVLLVGMRIPPNYGPRYTASFVQMYTDLSAQYRTPLVPFLLQSVALDSSKMQDDGLHPNALGEPDVLDTLWPQLVPLLKKDRRSLSE
jgi:acyl-CoA thioesterase I